MKEENIKTFLYEIDPSLTLVTSREWVNCCCPLAPLTHSSGKDTRPSFGVSVSEDSPSYFMCFGCTNPAEPLAGIFPVLHRLRGEYPSDLVDLYHSLEIYNEDEEAVAVPPKLPFSVDKNRLLLSPLIFDVDEKLPLLGTATGTWAKSARNYLRKERGVSPEIWDSYQVRVFKNAHCLVFPFTDMQGQSWSYSARKTSQKKMFTLTAEMLGLSGQRFYSPKYTGALFGGHLLDATQPLYLVEGELDALRLASLGYKNVVASGGAILHNRQLANLCAPRVILGYDQDQAGFRVTRRVTEKLSRLSVPTYLADWSPYKDAGALPSKDAADTILSQIEPA